MLEEKFKDVYGEIKVANSASKGYYMQIKNPRKENPNFRMCFPFRDITYGKVFISFSSEDLIKLNSRMNKTVEEIYMQSDKTISKLIQNIRAHVSCFYSLAEIVGNTDLVFSFTYQSSISNYVRPEFGNYLEIKSVSIMVFFELCFELLFSFAIGTSSNSRKDFKLFG